MGIFAFIALLLPIFGGLSLFLWTPNSRKVRNTFVFTLCAIVSVMVFALLGYRYVSGDEMNLLLAVVIAGRMELALHIDGLSMVFAAIVALLWPITNLYAFEYMSHEHGENRFFAFFTMTYGVVLGISFSANLFTLYFFYELLTLCTLSLVMHEMDGKAMFAGKKYLFYSMSGAALAFISMMFVLQYGSLDFTLGGSLDANLIGTHTTFLQLAFLLGFFGFGVKAAVFPFHGWLPSAGVAPTPVTALLHAVAVVNAGLFAVLRVLYYNYGTELLAGSFAQYIAMGAAVFTIVFGSAMALRLRHLKRRLAYSTISNLSYVLFAATLCTSAGLTAALLHMVVHSVLKITLFFCAGGLLCQTHHAEGGVQEYIHQYEGYGKKMPYLFATFTIASLGLIGVPPFTGFASKWAIAAAATASGMPLAYLGCFALVCSAFLTGMYQFGVLIYAYFPAEGFDEKKLHHISDPGWQMKTCFIFLTVLGFVLIFAMAPLSALLTNLATGSL
ncbi:MAG: proton-conducting transporter membrane subunit [Faecalibacterium sp.]